MKILIKLKNVYDNENIILSDEKGIFRVLEHRVDHSAKNLQQAQLNYYFSRTGVCRKQLLIKLKNESVCVNPGQLMFMCGDIDIKTNVKGMGDLINKAISSSITGEATIKPKYYGTGYVMLEHTNKYILLEQTDNENGIVISDATFLACSGNVKIKSIPVSTISSAALGKEGVFNLLLKGDGIVAFTSTVP
ncbi:MAG: AIM24 family protein, partial [Clostridiales bacterium]|nr:AIM24 family protein [Clostridiales bacterium]